LNPAGAGYSLGNAKLRSLEELAKEFAKPIEKKPDPTVERCSSFWGNSSGWIDSWKS